MPDRFEFEESLPLRYFPADDGQANRRDSQGAATRLRGWLAQNAIPTAGTTYQERLEHESQSLFSWAREEGFLIIPDSYKEVVSAYATRATGQEHHVYLPPPTSLVLKTTIPPNYGLMGSASDYLRNIELCNHYFGDDIRVIGIVELAGEPAIISTQPYIEGTKPKLKKILRWFEARGYESLGNDRFLHRELGIEVSDAHEGNFIQIAEGDLVPIDLHVTDLGETGKNSGD